MAARDPLAGVDWAAAFAKIAHDVRNPLATISNSGFYIAGRLAASAVKDEKVSKHLRMIDAEVQRANAILERLVSFFKPRNLETRRVGLNSWLESVLLEATLPKSVTVKKSLAAKEPVTLGDSDQLKAAARELIANAVEAMPAGGELRLSTASDGGTASVAISDTGAGLPDSVRGRLFTPFVTSKERHWGLGLATARRIVELHGGNLSVESGPKGGAVACLSLKAVPS